MIELASAFNEIKYYIDGATVNGKDVAVSAETALESLKLCVGGQDVTACRDCIFSRIDVDGNPCGKVMAYVTGKIMERLIEGRKTSQAYSHIPEIGRAIYFISRGRVHERTVCGVVVTEKGFEIRVKKPKLITYATLNGAEIGKTVFFDKELAERANQANRG